MTRQNKHILFLSLFLLMTSVMDNLNSQNKVELLSGEVSYITGQNVYVKFGSTQKIEKGDTLYTMKNEVRVPALLVMHLSSMSCLCVPIGDNTFKVGDILLATIKEKTVFPIHEKDIIEKDINEQALSKVGDKSNRRSRRSDFSGRLSLSSYSTFAEADQYNSHRYRYRLSMDAKNISDSKVSFETYLSFTHKSGEWDRVKDNLSDALKIYSLALKYDFNEATSLWTGRKINPKIANVGAVDGFQFQKQWNSLYTGVVVGSRPDYEDYGFNPDLLEYGAYIGHQSKVTNGFAQSSFAIFEQRNAGNIDRRFVYLQHSNSIIKDVTLFSSMELDLYKLEDGTDKTELNLIGLYVSLRYRFSGKISLFGSYDNRKNVIYYKTFQNYADEIIQQSSRQGYRFRLNYKPIKYMNLGFSAGTRSRDEDPRANNTLSANVTYSSVPFINASFTLNGNMMQTGYLDGQVFGGRLSKNLLNGKLYSVLNYRWVKFDYVNTSTQLKQSIGEVDLSYHFNKKLYMSVNFEATFQEENNSNRLYLNLRKKF
ncbi:hypothetical protein [Saccharicrinis sp. 156]|uniref:hypothetical protein n=1 Tax=Saccharicrinis sp. 156 TaxID=3417574 RepID=UPI003D3426A2